MVIENSIVGYEFLNDIKCVDDTQYLNDGQMLNQCDNETQPSGMYCCFGPGSHCFC